MLGDSIAKIPDPYLHKRISLIKSGLRIAGYAVLACGGFVGAALLLAGAEALGIVEEMV